MKRTVFALAGIVIGSALGFGSAEFALTSPLARDRIGLLFGRGHLLAIARGRGIYEIDLQRAVGEKKDEDAGERPFSRRSVFDELIARTMTEALARSESDVDPANVAAAFELLRAQFGEEKSWRAALARSGFSARTLRRNVATHLRAEGWIRARVGARAANPAECQLTYDTHRSRFHQPERFRASHLFLAAPPETSPDVVDLKEKTIRALAERLGRGEDFFELVAEASEDEANKTLGGDLGWFSESRMPPDFMQFVRQLAIRQVGPPVRTRLGFHIIELTDRQPPRDMTSKEAQPEIEHDIENEWRDAAVRDLNARLVAQAQLIAAPMD